jgi:hypothetical protein
VTDTSDRNPRRILLIAAIIGIVFCTFVVLALGFMAQRRDALLAQAVEQLRPGMTQDEVQATLKPLRADLMATKKNQKGGEYLFRGTDEFIIVLMDGTDDDAHVAKVTHFSDTGPWWERMRRNWEGRLR